MDITVTARLVIDVVNNDDGEDGAIDGGDEKEQKL